MISSEVLCQRKCTVSKILFDGSVPRTKWRRKKVKMKKKSKRRVHRIRRSEM